MSNIVMTQELADKLIAHYEAVKEECSGFTKADVVRSICRQNEVNVGICKASEIIFGIDVWLCDWVTSNCNGMFWDNIPELCHSAKRMIQCLGTRIDILKQFPN